jgi:subtilisin family serine protease
MRRSRLWLFSLLVLLLVACATTVGDVPDDLVATTAGSDVVPGRFIVVVRDGVDPRPVATAYGVQPEFVYRTALRGFAGAMSDAARSGLLRDARVLRIEPDRLVHAVQTTQSNATWGIDRVDQRGLPLSKSYEYVGTGAGVRAYVVDTGIRYTHNEFGGRAVFGFDAFGGNGNDCNGHGTHVAGTLGGSVYGVAKGVQLVAVRVLNCRGSGTTSGVIAGIDWVTADVVGRPLPRPAVANMSLGGGASEALDTAVRNSVAAGISYAVAAGNGNSAGVHQPACNYSPARVRTALTVGATTSSDVKTSWSNYGECVDVFAPGASITSAWKDSNTSIKTISGTSMAAPHVAGAVALYLQANPGATPTQVFSAVQSNATKDVVTKSLSTNNHLLYSLYSR